MKKLAIAMALVAGTSACGDPTLYDYYAEGYCFRASSKRFASDVQVIQFGSSGYRVITGTTDSDYENDLNDEFIKIRDLKNYPQVPTSDKSFNPVMACADLLKEGAHDFGIVRGETRFRIDPALTLDQTEEEARENNYVYKRGVFISKPTAIRILFNMYDLSEASYLEQREQIKRDKEEEESLPDRIREAEEEFERLLESGQQERGLAPR